MPDPVRTLRAEPLRREAFAEFGDVIEAPGGPGRAVNLGTARRFDWAAALESTRAGAKPNLAVFRCDPQALPFRVTLFERHPHSTQLFAALSGGRWLTIVAPSRADGWPDETAARAFLGGPGQGINLRRGLWHHPLVVLDVPAEMLMLAWEDGGPGDGEEHPLAAAFEVDARQE